MENLLAVYDSRNEMVASARSRLAQRILTKDSIWQDRALCSVADPSIFENPQGKDTKRLAKAFCDACEVAYRCETFGKSIPGSEGLVWGGKMGGKIPLDTTD